MDPAFGGWGGKEDSCIPPFRDQGFGAGHGNTFAPMIPILSAEQFRQADARTIADEPISSLDLMERAAGNCARKLMETLPKDVPVVVLAGLGNNGGDGLVMARILHQAGQKDVSVVVPRYKDFGSTDFEANLKRLLETTVHVKFLDQGAELPALQPEALVIDALFGTGLERPITGWLKSIIVGLNARQGPVLSIDLPSGLFAGDNTGNDLDAVVWAKRTFTLELPKLPLLLPDLGSFAGEWEVVPIGLDRQFIASVPAQMAIVERADVAELLPRRARTAHKGDFGHAWLLCGGPGKMGAAMLAVRACLRSGCGLLTVHVPEGQGAAMNAVVPEAMVSVDDRPCLSRLPRLSRASALGIGPGIGTADETARLVKVLVQEAPAPLVLDADALNILSENKTWLAFLPAGSILTPHPKEFERLAGKADSGYARLMQARDLAMKHRLVVVLKGAHTATCAPDGRIYFNNTGNAGMAKGGSGDVLTGIITGLRAQGLDPLSAALLGVHAHGLAGDLAAREIGMQGMLPSDLTERLPSAWKELALTSSGPTR